ncbi:hypothetical protein, partial [Ruegeria sp. HKCCD7255]|uniref:hypothetical protein n=1 Tax=Ruegeria sp. HKCCD7255 TaxID=2683004 RepID=UPI001C2C80AD
MFLESRLLVLANSLASKCNTPCIGRNPTSAFPRRKVSIARAAKDRFPPILWKNNLLLAQKEGRRAERE